MSRKGICCQCNPTISLVLGSFSPPAVSFHRPPKYWLLGFRADALNGAGRPGIPGRRRDERGGIKGGFGSGRGTPPWQTQISGFSGQGPGGRGGPGVQIIV